VLISTDNHDQNPHLVKYSSTGVKLWEMQRPGVAIISLCADAADNFYLQSGKEFEKVDKDGNSLWTKPYNLFMIMGKHVDAQNNLVANCVVNDQFVTPTNDTLKQPTVFLGKFDPDGNCLWAVPNGTVSWGRVSVDPAGNIYALGGFFNAVTLGSGVSAVTLTSTEPYGESFLAKYNANGKLLWAKKIWRCLQVANDAAGNLYTYQAKNNSHSWSITQYDGLGNVLWEVPLTFSEAWGEGDLDCGTEAVYFTNSYNGTVSAGGLTAGAPLKFGCVVAAINFAGHVKWLISSSLQNLQDDAISVHASDIYITGTISGKDSMGGAEIDKPGDTFFTLMINDAVGTVGMKINSHSTTPIKISPNPAQSYLDVQNYENEKTSGLELRIFNSAGQVVALERLHEVMGVCRIKLPDLPPGIYQIQFSDIEVCQRMKLVIE
jgi:hypothetical protein